LIFFTVLLSNNLADTKYYFLPLQIPVSAVYCILLLMPAFFPLSVVGVPIDQITIKKKWLVRTPTKKMRHITSFQIIGSQRRRLYPYPDFQSEYVTGISETAYIYEGQFRVYFFSIVLKLDLSYS